MKRMLLLVLALALVAPATADDWILETVDSDGRVGEYTSLALDSSGNPHISYLDYTNYGLKYAAWNGASWEIETVDSSADVGWNTSLALDSSGNPHISYLDYDNYDLKYAAWNGASWDIETVDSDGNVGGFTSLALDSSGNPHISYYYLTNHDLKYAHWNGASWNLETVDSDGVVGWDTSLALDSSGNPHISYWDHTNDDLKYARWNGASWEIETVDSGGDVGEDTSLALDSSGNPHISYWDHTNDDLKYAHWNGASWEIEMVDSDDEVGYFNSLALDSSGNPHISYYYLTNHDLKYAHWNGASWDIETVDSDGDVGSFTSLALDSSGNPYISYWDYTNYDLKYAAWNGSSWDIETVDSDGDVGRDTSLALDSSGNPHISYWDLSNGNLKYSWHNEAPPAFSLLSPSDGATVDDYPLCDWEDAPDYPTVSYDLWYSTESDFDPHEELSGLTDSEYQFSDTELDPDTTYHWKVVATDGYLETWSSETWSFYVPNNVGIDGVELAANPAADGVLLGWTVSGDVPAGVRVLRGEHNPVAVSGTLPGETRRWLDRDVEPGEGYVYWLEATDSDGRTERYGPTETVVVPDVERTLTLEAPWPSPATNGVTLSFELPEGVDSADITIYDLAGRIVESFSIASEAGRQAISLNTAAYRPGVYLATLATDAASETRRFVISR